MGRQNRKASFVTVAALLAAPTAALADQSTFQLGIGTMTCAYWQSTPQLEGEGDAWILGFWTGLNTFNKFDNAVGTQTDGNNILSKVKHNCGDHPPWLMLDVAMATYRAMYRDVHGKPLP